jgi:N-acetylglucosamine-6-phosphate deacetylase
MTLLVHRARLLDCNGASDDSWLLAADGTITAVGLGDTWRSAVPSDAATMGSIETIDASGGWVVPGFIDLHVHGGGGASFEEGPDAIVRAVEVHGTHGTTRTLISLVSSPPGVLTSRLADIAELTRSDPRVLGSHLEGPYLAAARRGAHDAAALRANDPGEVEQLLDAASGTLRQLTLAPELPGALAAISRLVDAGVAVAVGHTNADYEQARAAFGDGASILTHAFNAMPGIHHRAPGPVMAAIDSDGVTLEIVNDGHHVAPSVVRLAFGAAPGRIALVSDAMAAAGGADGDYTLGSRNIHVRHGMATVAGTETLAGSTLTLDEALRQTLALGLPPADAIAALTSTPAHALGLGDRLGQLRPGYAADLVLLDESWMVQRVLFGGAAV